MRAIVIITIVFSFFFVSNLSAQKQTRGSKSLDRVLGLKSTTEDTTDDFGGRARYNKKTKEWKTLEYNDSRVRNHYWYLAATGGFDTKSSGYEANMEAGRHMRGCNIYVSAGVRQMSLDKQFDVRAVAVQAVIGAQWEIVSTFKGHSRWQVAIGPEIGGHHLDYKPTDWFRWYGFSVSTGGSFNVSYKLTEVFSIGTYAKYRQFKVNNEWIDFDTKEVHNMKVDYKTFSVGASLIININTIL